MTSRVSITRCSSLRRKVPPAAFRVYKKSLRNGGCLHCFTRIAAVITGTHQKQAAKELALTGITHMAAANRYLKEIYVPAFNAEFKQQANGKVSAFGLWIVRQLAGILCEQHECVVGHDNCVSFEGLKLQIPTDRHRAVISLCKYQSDCPTLSKQTNGNPARTKEACRLQMRLARK